MFKFVEWLDGSINILIHIFTHFLVGEMNLAHDEIRMFPEDEVLREGSTVMFCCIYSTETNITSMFFNNTEYKVINISPQVKAIRVENIKATNTYGVNFYCRMDSIVVNSVICEFNCPIQFSNSPIYSTG